MTNEELKEYNYKMATALIQEFLDKLIAARMDNNILKNRIKELEEKLNMEHLKNTNQGI